MCEAAIKPPPGHCVSARPLRSPCHYVMNTRLVMTNKTVILVNDAHGTTCLFSRACMLVGHACVRSCVHVHTHVFTVIKQSPPIRQIYIYTNEMTFKGVAYIRVRYGEDLSNARKSN